MEFAFEVALGILGGSVGLSRDEILAPELVGELMGEETVGSGALPVFPLLFYGYEFDPRQSPNPNGRGIGALS